MANRMNYPRVTDSVSSLTFVQKEAFALSFALMAHGGQFRKDSVTPYMTHIRRVVGKVKQTWGSQCNEVLVAFLHDVVEDSSINFADLRGIFDSTVVDAVNAITKRPHQGGLWVDGAGKWDFNETYKEYIIRCAQKPIAARVKVIDIRDNMNDDPNIGMQKRYQEGLGILREYGYD